jgi:nitrite reductase (NADH) large subunit
VKKEDLVNVWKDIGMPSGHAYAKALRTVKTCVGSEWCRMGTQDSTQMGKDLERAMWRMYAPHKVKFAVSRAARATAPRPASRTWASSVWTAAGRCMWPATAASRPRWRTSSPSSRPPPRCWSTPAPSCELYRQEGWYLERTVHYVNRVGLDYVKKRILDDHEGRKALWEQLQFALDGEPDPWFDIA